MASAICFFICPTMSITSFFTEAQKKSIQEAIQRAESNTSGEIRVHLDSKCKGDVLKQAQKVFNRLGMAATKDRNGVLFYLAVDDRKFAILGDKGIHENVPEGFWDSIRVGMEVYFKKQEFAEGLCNGIDAAGQKLKIHFPLASDDTNELSDDLSFGK